MLEGGHLPACKTDVKKKKKKHSTLRALNVPPIHSSGLCWWNIIFHEGRGHTTLLFSGEGRRAACVWRDVTPAGEREKKA